jgi:hypothetical protein
VIAVFPTVHVAHGLGMLMGWVRSSRPGRRKGGSRRSAPELSGDPTAK